MLKIQFSEKSSSYTCIDNVTHDAFSKGTDKGFLWFVPPTFDCKLIATDTDQLNQLFTLRVILFHTCILSHILTIFGLQKYITAIIRNFANWLAISFHYHAYLLYICGNIHFVSSLLYNVELRYSLFLTRLKNSGEICFESYLKLTAWCSSKIIWFTSWIFTVLFFVIFFPTFV